MRWLVDTTTPNVLPTNVDMVGGYVNGRFAWTHENWARFPGATQVRINVNGAPGRGNCLDVETGDATPGHAPIWYDSINWMPKGDLLIYCNRSNVGAVIAAMGKRSWHLWLATLDGSIPNTVNGKTVTAVQMLGAAQLHQNIDLSAVLDNTWRKV